MFLKNGKTFKSLVRVIKFEVFRYLVKSEKSMLDVKICPKMHDVVKNQTWEPPGSIISFGILVFPSGVEKS